MKEPHIEGVATHDGPESCVDVRRGVGEALTGVRVGEVLSREVITSGCRRGSGPARQHDQVRYRESLIGSARSEALCMHEILHAREPGDPFGPPVADGGCGPTGEAEP
jgi:RNA-directed DNA polymerase